MKILRERRKDAAFHATRQRGKKCCGSVAGLLLFLLPLISLIVNRVAGVAPFSRSYTIPSFGQAKTNPGFQMGCPGTTANQLSHSTENGEEPNVAVYLVDNQRCSGCSGFFEIICIFNDVLCHGLLSSSGFPVNGCIEILIPLKTARGLLVGSEADRRCKGRGTKFFTNRVAVASRRSSRPAEARRLCHLQRTSRRRILSPTRYKWLFIL